MTKERGADELRRDGQAILDEIAGRTQDKAVHAVWVRHTLCLLDEIDRLRHALYCIKVEYAYCTQCSASALAAQVLEQK